MSRVHSSLEQIDPDPAEEDGPEEGEWDTQPHQVDYAHPTSLGNQSSL